MRSFAALLALVLVAIGIGIAAESPGTHGVIVTPSLGSRGPRMYVPATGPCPSSTHATDVIATAGSRSSRLLAQDALFGIACRYEKPANSSSYALVRTSFLSGRTAREISTLLQGANDARPTGTVICPAEFFEMVVLAFGYANGRSVDLFYQNSGCQTLDNGRITTYELENPAIFEHLSSIVTSLLGASTP